MTSEELFKVVTARHFFKQYAPQVKRFYHKLNGIDGNKKPIDFTDEDKKAIKDGIKLLQQDLKKVKL